MRINTIQKRDEAECVCVGGKGDESQSNAAHASSRGAEQRRRLRALTLSTLVCTISIISMRFSAGMGSLERTTGVPRSFRSAVSWDMSAAMIYVATNRPLFCRSEQPPLPAAGHFAYFVVVLL